MSDKPKSYLTVDNAEWNNKSADGENSRQLSDQIHDQVGIFPVIGLLLFLETLKSANHHPSNCKHL